MHMFIKVCFPCVVLISFTWHIFNGFFQMTFVKLIKDLTLSFGEMQRKNTAYSNFCTKNSQKMTKQRKH